MSACAVSVETHQRLHEIRAVLSMVPRSCQADDERPRGRRDQGVVRIQHAARSASTVREPDNSRKDDQCEEGVDEKLLSRMSCADQGRMLKVANSDPAFWPATGMATKTLRELTRSLRPIDAPSRASRGHERQATSVEQRRDLLEALIPAQ